MQGRNRRASTSRRPYLRSFRIRTTLIMRIMSLLQITVLTVIIGSTFAEDSITVTLRHGGVKGTQLTILGKTIEAYLGIPFAEPPIGRLRFQKPQPAKPWSGVLDATNPKSSCMQQGMPGIVNIKGTSEDCLFVNVLTPGRGGPLKSVMVWIHGGGFQFGSSYQDWYNASALVATQDVVVVTLNYRLGAFGFLSAHTSEAPGNVGLYDQSLALQWVRDNVDVFGGNPDEVTLFGESAGSMSIQAHILSPLSEGLFRRAIMMSGTLYCPGVAVESDDMLRRANRFARHAGCATLAKDLATHPDGVLECLRAKPAEELQVHYENFEHRIIKRFLPIHGDEFLPVAPCLAMARGLFKNVDIMGGVTQDEGTFMVIAQPDKRLLEEDLQHIIEEEMETVLHSVMRVWTPEVNSDVWRHYENQVNPSTWKVSYRKAAADYITDNLFKCPHKLLSDRLSSRESSVYSYVFGHRSEMTPLPKWAGASHAGDIFYFFGLPLVYPDQYTDGDREFSKDVMKMACTFAKRGVPELPTGEKWPRYSVEDPVSVYVKPGNFTTLRDPDLSICDLWQEGTC